MKCPRCQQKNPSPTKFCPECGIPLGFDASTVGSYADLQGENEGLRRALADAAEQQAATAEILKVISSSPNDVQPVFDTIVRSAVRLCSGVIAGVSLVRDGMLHHPANYGGSPEALAAIRKRFPRPLDMRSTTGVAILTRAVYETPDAEDPSVPEFTREAGRTLGVRSFISVPMLREGNAIGAITVTSREPGHLSEAEVALLRTFADQAVIAIENVRLFNETKEALDRQTATSEILGVISRSPTDEQPVFDAIVRSARRLCEATYSGVFLAQDGQLTLAAVEGIDAAGIAAIHTAYPRPIARDTTSGRAILDRRLVHLEDSWVDPDYTHPLRNTIGLRSILTIPFFRDGVPTGALSVWRPEVRPFSDKQIALLQTFADQAVIAIENVRLFKELQTRTGELTRSVDELRALGEVSQALSSTLDVDVVLDTIITRANDLIGADGCTIFEYDEATEQFHLRATRNLEPGLVELARGTPLRKGDQGILGQLPIGRRAFQVPDITAGSYSSPISDALIDAGYRAVVAVPLIREDHLIGALTMNRKTPGDFPAETIELLQTFATQSALAIQNARLFREIELKSRQLEVASQHKSEFLANMSHELRTPLNAIIGFSEVLSERMFGELNEKQDEYLKDIHASGQHLLSLINDILDLSKIEAGRMELELTDFDLPATIDNALTLVRERAGRRGVALHQAIDARLGLIRADERKIKQVLLNLLSNALKFTPEGGRIDIRGGLGDGVAEISVADTGVGIAPEDQEAIFEEFKQVGTAAKKVEGTGLGLALSRKFIELHGGRIWVKSEIGQGSTFTFTIPLSR